MHDNCLFKIALSSNEELQEEGQQKRQRLNSGNELSKWKKPLVPNYAPLEILDSLPVICPMSDLAELPPVGSSEK